MAGTALAYAVSASNLFVKWREQYASEGLAKGLRAGMGRGVLRGFRPAPGVGDREITLAVDPTTGDSTLLGAGALPSDNEAVFYRETAAVVLDCSAFALNTTFILALVMNYSVGSATTAEYRVYTVPEYTGGALDADEATALCRFTTPAIAGPVTSFDLSITDHAWKWKHHGAQPEGDEVVLANLQPNSRVDMLVLTGTGNGGLALIPSTLGAQIGTRTATWGTTGSPATGSVTVKLVPGASVREGEQLSMRVRYSFDNVVGPPVATISFAFVGADGNTLIGTVSQVLPAVAGDNYYERAVDVPSNAALVQVVLTLSIPDPNSFSLSSFLLTGRRAESDVAGAPDTVNRLSVPPLVAERLLLVPLGDALEGGQITAAGNGRIVIQSAPTSSQGSIDLAPPTDSILMPINLQGATRLGGVSAVDNDPAVPYLTSETTLGSVRVLWEHTHTPGAKTATLATEDGSLSLVSGGVWDATTSAWVYDGSADLLALTVDPSKEAVLIRGLDQSQFPGVQATYANMSTSMRIPVLKRLATEDPIHKDQPKFAFDVGNGATRQNLIMENRAGTTGQAHRTYERGTAGLQAITYSTVNLRFNHALAEWNRDVPADFQATVVRQSHDSWGVAYVAGGSDPITDGEVNSTALIFEVTNNAGNGLINLRKPRAALATDAWKMNAADIDFRIEFGTSNGTPTADARSTNPDYIIPITNTLTAKSIVKSWGVLALPQPANPAPGVVTLGLNILSVSLSAPNTTLNIVFSAPFKAGTAPCVTANLQGSVGFVVIALIAPTLVALQVYDAAGVIQDLSAAPIGAIHFHAHGVQ